MSNHVGADGEYTQRIIFVRACIAVHDANLLSHLFSKRFGISMLDYRAQNRAR